MSDFKSGLDARIIRPTSPDVLQDRALALSTERLLSFVDRAELAGITTLLIQGNITRENVWKTLLRFYWISEDSDNEFLAPVRADLDEVWMRLDALASNVVPTPTEEPIESFERPVPRWFVDAMRLVNDELRGHRLFDGDAIELVPRELILSICHRMLVNEYGSPYAIGYSLEAQPTLGGGTGFGGRCQGIWVADALAQALLYSANVYDEIMDQRSDEARIELGRLHLWWMLLKGFTYSLAHRRLGLQTLHVLVDNPEMHNRIKQALTTGLKRVRDTEIATIPKWGGMVSDTAHKVQTTPTQELIELLDKRVAETKEEMIALANFHR